MQETNKIQENKVHTKCCMTPKKKFLTALRKASRLGNERILNEILLSE